MRSFETPSADAFEVHRSEVRDGLSLAYVREGVGGYPVLLLHGYPETKRIWWRNIAPLAEARFCPLLPRPASPQAPSAPLQQRTGPLVGVPSADPKSGEAPTPTVGRKVWGFLNKDIDPWLEDQASASYQRSVAQQEQVDQPSKRLVCPHCQQTGSVKTKLVKVKRGIHGAKATDAILTGGVSMLVTGLSDKRKAMQATC